MDIFGSLFPNDYDYNQIIVNDETGDKSNMLILGIFISILTSENLTNKRIKKQYIDKVRDKCIDLFTGVGITKKPDLTNWLYDNYNTDGSMTSINK